MSAQPVDVLAVMAVMQNKAQIYDSLPGGTDAQAADFQRQYLEARAAVAELIEADREYDETRAAHRDRDSYETAGPYMAAMERRAAALARIGGAA